MITSSVQTSGYSTFTNEYVVLIGISVLIYMIMCVCLAYLENKRKGFTERSLLTILLVAGVLPVIVSFTIGCFITYLIFK